MSTPSVSPVPSPAGKVELRRLLRRQLGDSVPARLEKSRALCARLLRHPRYVASRRVAIFDAMPVEPEVELLWELAPREFFYPRVHGESLLVLPVLHPRELHLAAGGKFSEPALPAKLPEQLPELDVIILPGLGFTREGARLGRGGGYYDRLLAQLPASTWRVGVCFSSQLCQQLPLEPHDMPLHAVATEDALWEAAAPLVG